jgi:copper chaperone
VQTVYTVTGMTCAHCARSVTEELSELEGVTGVSVDVPTGAVTVSSNALLAKDKVAAAVSEAGYQLTS